MIKSKTIYALITVVFALVVGMMLIADFSMRRFETIDENLSITRSSLTEVSEENQVLKREMKEVKQVNDSLLTTYSGDSARWLKQQRFLHTRYMKTLQQLKKTEKLLDESVRSQRIVVPRLDNNRPQSGTEPGN